ncbi:GNAT family N-acetyltransferase [Parendozoicomonas sp. Alg238-R29]|uniref:GNAT family N-acetyltransferase n=1 Tax=Parendozoicomonas sp. Alg238-R29 TaxID=2993446 RepID=UPI00248DA514|nr:GNAT family N-acetyltransferase [Parendozoicomonas sp. Alg238-R29]
MDIPQIETDRLILRGLREEDFPAYAQWCTNPKFMKHIGPQKPISREDAWRSMAMVVGHWPLRGFGFWALEEKATGELVGRAGLFEPEGWPGTEVGWGLDPNHWGKGYATEAAKAAVKWGFENTDNDELISLISPDNHPSIKVSERIGQTFSRNFNFHGNEISIYSLSRSALK